MSRSALHSSSARSTPRRGVTASNSEERRVRRLLKRRECYARKRLRELRTVCPDLPDEVLQRHTLHSIVWALRRAGKRGVQTLLPRSDTRESAGHVEENGSLPTGVLQR